MRQIDYVKSAFSAGYDTHFFVQKRLAQSTLTVSIKRRHNDTNLKKHDYEYSISLCRNAFAAFLLGYKNR